MLSLKKKVYKEEKPLNNEKMMNEDSLKIVSGGQLKSGCEECFTSAFSNTEF